MSDWRKTTEYRHWRAQVLWRDRACVMCNSKKSPNAHHVNHATYFPDLRFDLDNGVTLCYDCHMNYHCQFNRSYRTLCDEYNFLNFLKLAVYMSDMWRTPTSNALLDGYSPSTSELILRHRSTIETHYEGSMIVPLVDVQVRSRTDSMRVMEERCIDANRRAMAFEAAPDSVVGYVTELASLRRPA